MEYKVVFADDTVDLYRYDLVDNVEIVLIE